MTADTDLATDMIDVAGLSLADLEGLPEGVLRAALRETLAGTPARASAGFSSRLGR